MMKMRVMSKTELDTYLNSKNPEWVYGGFSVNKHFWTLPTETQFTGIMIALKLSFEGSDKQKIQIITGNPKVNTDIMNQVNNYKMKKIYSKIDQIEDDDGLGSSEMLTEVYDGVKYKITFVKARNETGELIVSNLLEKK